MTPFLITISPIKLQFLNFYLKEKPQPEKQIETRAKGKGLREHMQKPNAQEVCSPLDSRPPNFLRKGEDRTHMDCVSRKDCEKRKLLQFVSKATDRRQKKRRKNRIWETMITI
jgi:hypothetical protein